MTLALENQRALRFEIDENGLGVLTIDVPGRMNVLAPAVFQEIHDTVQELKARTDLRVLLIRSAKKDNFIAGADISTIATITNPEQGEAMAAQAQGVFNELESLEVPTLCAIHGPCLGGGLELALATDYRLASDDDKTQIGLPEVQLGVLPGAGGTQRLTHLIGLPDALDMILAAKRLRATQALKKGVVDEVVPKELLEERARQAAMELAEGKGMAVSNRAKRQKSMAAQVMDQVGTRSVVYAQTRAELRKKTKGHYPAPFKALDAIMAATRKPLEEGLAIEARLFGELAASDVSKSLIHIFNTTTELKAETGLPKGSKVKARTIDKIGILGGGLMGSGIATVLADKGYHVRVKDRNNEVLGKTLQYAYKVYQKKVSRRRMRAFERDLRMARISPTTDYTGFKKAGMVIEAVFEDMSIKHQVLRDVEATCGPDTIFASNTSSLPIGEIAKGGARPENVIGMHFFSPVEKMPLVEVIVHPGTADWVTATTVEVSKRMGKHVIVVNDGVGFYTSRVLAPFCNEAARMLFEGGSIDEIDRAMTDFGFPVGPITLLDEVGIDVVSKVMKIMQHGFPGRFTVPEGWEVIPGDNRLGRKNKRGFYSYRSATKEPDHAIYDLLPGGKKRHKLGVEQIQKRCVFAFLNECALCLQEGVLRTPRDGDVGAVFGLGFPPFLGGPFLYMDKLGLKNVVDTLRQLHDHYGPIFKPAGILEDMAREGKTFFPK